MKVILPIVLLVLTGCSTAPSKSVSPNKLIYSDTMKIIENAAESAPSGIYGEYVLKVKAAGTDGPAVFLNTQHDYRDQRNITVAIHPRLVREFTEKFGISPKEYFINKSISVAGEAKRIKTEFTYIGIPTEKILLPDANPGYRACTDYACERAGLA